MALQHLPSQCSASWHSVCVPIGVSGSHLTCSESVPNLSDDGFIGRSDSGRSEHKHKVKDECIAGILLIIYAAWRAHNAVVRYIPVTEW